MDDVGEPCDKQITGHTARRSGAQFLARRGLAVWAIQYVGRWGGDSVKLYVAQAFADRRATLAVDAARGRTEQTDYDTELWELVEAWRESGAPPTAAAAPPGIAIPLADPGEVAAVAVNEVATQTDGSATRSVTNLGTGLSHILAPDWAETLPPHQWQAWCGWAFAGRAFRLGRSEPAHPICKWCLRKRARLEGEPVGVHVPGETASGSG